MNVTGRLKHPINIDSGVTRDHPKKRSLSQRLFRTEPTDTLPLSVTHDRIYILPRRRGWAFLVALLIILIASINYSLSLGYALCFLLTGLFSATLLATYRNKAGVTVTAIEDADAVAGEPLRFSVVLTGKQSKNDHIDIELHGEHCRTCTNVTAGMDTRLELPRTTHQRDVLSLGRLTIESDYPLGLWRAWAYVHAPITGYVSPKPEPNAPPPPAASNSPDQEPEGLIDNTRVDVAGEFAGIRPYRPGDTPAAIAWKQMARGTGLHAREFNGEVSPDRLALDWELTKDLGETEARLSRLAAWVDFAHRTARPYELTLGKLTLGSMDVGSTNRGSSKDGQHSSSLTGVLADADHPTGNNLSEPGQPPSQQQVLRQLAAFGHVEKPTGAD